MPFVGFQATHKGNKLCCAAKKQITKNIKDFWNSDYLKNVRNRMIKGEKLNVMHKTDKFAVYLLKTGDKFTR